MSDPQFVSRPGWTLVTSSDSTSGRYGYAEIWRHSSGWQVRRPRHWRHYYLVKPTGIELTGERFDYRAEAMIVAERRVEATGKKVANVATEAR